MRSTLALLLLFLLASALSLNAQDSIRYANATTIGYEIGEFSSNEPNDFYLESLHGISFNKRFHLLVGPGFISYEALKIMPLMISARKVPTNQQRWGYSLNLGYTFPISGSSTLENQTNYELTEGGTYFNFSGMTLLYEGTFAAYFVFGYRIYSYTEKYNEPLWNGRELTIEDEVTSRVLTLGVTVSF